MRPFHARFATLTLVGLLVAAIPAPVHAGIGVDPIDIDFVIPGIACGDGLDQASEGYACMEIHVPKVPESDGSLGAPTMLCFADGVAQDAGADPGCSTAWEGYGYRVGTLYEHKGYAGKILPLYFYTKDQVRNDGNCYGDYMGFFDRFPAYMNDKASSAKGHGGCTLTLWEHYNYFDTGRSATCRTTCSDLGAQNMNDRASWGGYYCAHCS